MTYGNNPPGGYGNQPPEDYRGQQQGGYGPQQGGYGDQQQGGYGSQQGGPQQGGYGSQQQGGYGPQQGGYGPSPQQGGYGNPQQQGGYGNQAGGYANPPGSYASPGYQDPTGYSPGGYPPAPGGYGAPGPVGYGGYAAPGNYASWLQRVGAYLIDVVPVGILYGIALATRSTAILAVFVLIAIGITAYNRWYQAGKTGQSWGKRALNITLLSETTGQPIGPGMAFVRDICHFVDGVICYIGYLFPLWDAKRQTLADKIVRTVVVPV
jgi:uncharacterized RDD family membrane protein YckC